MKNLKTLLLSSVITMSMISCENNEDINTAIEPDAAKLSLAGSQTHHNCGFIDNNWPQSAVLSTTNIVNTAETNFLVTQNENIANLFNINTVPLGFAIGQGTLNAISYGQGYIIFGEALYNFALDNGGRVSVAMVQAHEVAHQLQFRNNLPSRNESTARAAELEADAFAGYYIGNANGLAADWPSAADGYTFAARLGDNNVNSPGHHGTAAQRRSAYRLGWLLRETTYSGARNFDSTIFRYYDRYVLAGALRSSEVLKKPEGTSQKVHDYIMSKMEELNKISSGEITDEEYRNLKS